MPAGNPTIRGRGIMSGRGYFWQGRWGSVLIRALLVLLVVNTILWFLPLNRYERWMNFRARIALDQGPALDPRIKILAMDDRTISWLERRELTMAGWVDTILKIADRKPAAVLIPKLFTLVPGESGTDRKKLISRLENLDFPLITSAFVTPRRIPYREPIWPEGKEYDLPAHLTGAGGNKGEQIARLGLPSASWAYGSHKDLRRILRRPGHLQYQDEGHVTPFYLSAPQRVLPHMMLLVAIDWQFDNGQLRINKAPVGLDRNGNIPLNYSVYPHYFKRTYSMAGIFNPEAKLNPLDLIEPGDYVVVIPDFYSGGTRFKDSPVGMIPLVYTSLPVLNSVLTGQWLQPVKSLYWPGWLQLMAVLAFAICWFSGIRLAMVSLAVLILLFTLGGIACFVGSGLEWPWLSLGSWYLLSGLLTVLSRVMTIESASRRLNRTISGLLPPDQVEAVMKDPSILNLRPEKHMVTIMFIDIVGFSLTSQKMTPVGIFNEVKEFLAGISRIVLKWNGVVDKTMGDGMLCFFGFDIGRKDSTDHVNNAVHAAQEIQLWVYEHCRIAVSQGRPVLPLRIGINTDEVIIGNMGGDSRTDITMMGDGVNFASRLETCCDPFKIMIGQSSREFLGSSSAHGLALVNRKVQIKHFDKLVEAWELDPFFDFPEKLQDLKSYYWAWSDFSISDERIKVSSAMGLKMQLNGEYYSVLNFSRSGFQIRGEGYLGRGVTLSAWIDNANGTLGTSLEEANLVPFLVEIKSGTRIDAKSFNLGVYIPGLNDKQRQKIFEALQNSLNQYLGPYSA